MFLILIAVALFAALSYAITSSSRSGSNSSKERDALYASQLIQFGTMVEAGVKRLTMTGTPIHLQDFSHNLAPSANLANDNCADVSCQVYNSQGGGVAPIDSWPLEARDAENPDTFNFVVTTIQVLDLGTALPEVAFRFIGISDSICHLINNKLNGRDAQIETFGGVSLRIEGDLSAIPDGASSVLGDVSDQYRANMGFCALHGQGNYYIHVLKVR